MTKKLLISTLILAASGLASLATVSPPVNAAKLTIDGTDYWTIDEVTKTGQKYVEDLKMCEGNRECEEYLDTAYILAENEYSAGQAFMNNYFFISAISPTESTIRVVFHDEANKWMLMEDDSKKDIMKNLFLCWLDNGQVRWLSEFNNPEYKTNAQDIFVHLATPGEEWLEPNKEVELKIPNFDFSRLKTSRIFFYARSEKSDAAGDRDISACMNAIEGLNGYECQAVFDWLGNISYQPIRAKISTNTIEVPAEPVVDDTPKEITKEKISTSSIRVPENETELAPIISTTTNKSASNNTSEVALNVPSEATSEPTLESTSSNATPIPNTLEVPLAANKREEEHQFPWWLVAFGFSGVFLILWWLIPSKKSKKTLDKR